MRNYRFAIVQYAPRDEFDLRSEVQKLSTELVANGWVVFSIDLHKLLLDRVRAQGDEWVRRVIDMERQTAAVAPERGLNYLKSKLTPLIEGPDGIAADCSRVICEYADRNPDLVDRTLALIGRAGAIYPFFRTSALLRHLDGRTRNVPVVLLYPGERAWTDRALLHGDAEPRQRLPAAHLSLRLTVIIRDLFLSDVTRDIPPVVYFHEQTPEKLASEVSEYIITGGWPDDHPESSPRARRHPRAIREASARRSPRNWKSQAGLSYPNAWISGFYGSGKSSFAKLFGLALDGVALPDGSSLAEALLRRDLTPRAEELRKAWNASTPEGRAARRRLRHRRHRPRQRAHPRRRRPPGPEAARLLLDRAARRRLRAQARTGQRMEALRGSRRQSTRQSLVPAQGQAACRGRLLARSLEALSGQIPRPDELVHEPRRRGSQGRVARGRGCRHPRYAQVP